MALGGRFEQTLIGQRAARLKRAAPAFVGAASAVGLLVALVCFLLITSDDRHIGAVPIRLAVPVLTQERPKTDIAIQLGRNTSDVVVRSGKRVYRTRASTSRLGDAICAGRWLADDASRVVLYAEDDVSTQQLVNADQLLRRRGVSKIAIALFPPNILFDARSLPMADLARRCALARAAFPPTRNDQRKHIGGTAWRSH